MARQADDTIKQADTALVGIVERIEHDGTEPAAVARLRKVPLTNMWCAQTTTLSPPMATMDHTIVR